MSIKPVIHPVKHAILKSVHFSWPTYYRSLHISSYIITLVCVLIYSLFIVLHNGFPLQPCIAATTKNVLREHLTHRLITIQIEQWMSSFQDLEVFRSQ